MHPAAERSVGYAIAAPVVTTVEVAGREAVFPVARVFCVGRNYAEHAVEMGRSFGASRRALFSQIVLRAALPELLAGIRLGLIRGLKGVVIGQLLIAVIGVGYLFELYSRNFLMPEFWALLIILFAFAFLASEAVAYFERKVSFYASSR